jgi:hypothetical protein
MQANRAVTFLTIFFDGFIVLWRLTLLYFYRRWDEAGDRA